MLSSEYEPRFTEPLQASYLIREGHPVKLSCRFDASPRGNIQWLKDGIPIDFEALGISRDFKVVKEVDYTALLIKEAFPEDAGSYTVVIRNNLGEARSFTQLSVEEYFCRTPESEMSDTPCKPIFVQSLVDATINEGETLKLRAALNAHPEPEIIWYRNNIPLKNSRDLMLTFDGQLCTLTKDRCEKENDTGIYRITAVNSVGQAESICQVLVQSNETQIFRQHLQSTRSLPVFIQSLQDQTIQEGETFLLKIRTHGQPKPQVMWYKDNQPIRNTSDYQIRIENDIHILEIPRISVHHAGFYQVKAFNTEGEAKSSAAIHILPRMNTSESMTIESNGYPPKFQQLFNDRTTSIGSTIKFEARLTGTQPLNVYWLFNGSPITRLGNNQHYQQNVFNDIYSLTINNVRYEDIGKYSLNAENSWGKVTCTAELLVPPTLFRIGTDNSKKMLLSDLLVKLSPSPPVSRKRQMETNEQQQSLSSALVNTHTYEQESSFKRSRPIQSPSLIRHVRQYPKTLEIFKPSNTTGKEQEKHTTITRSYEYDRRRSSSENVKQPRMNDREIGREYLRCLDDLTNEYEKLKQQKKSFDNKSNYETKENYEFTEEIYRHQPRQIENSYQRSLSESLLYKRLKPITTTDITLSDNNLFNMEYRLKRKERLKPIRIHSSSSSIPGETSIKYVCTERKPVEVLVPKPQIITTQGEHSSTIVKDTRRSSRTITTNIHQQPRRRTIEGQHELRIIEQPITSDQTRTVEFTIPKPMPIEHSSTFMVKSKKGGRFNTMDISRTLARERTLSGEHALRVISAPIRSSSHNKPLEVVFPKPLFSSSSSSSHHSSTVVKQNRTPKSSLFLDNIQRTLKGEHELRLIEQPIQSGSANTVELIVPKSVTDTAEHTTTVITETQPHRRVLEITGSGRQMTSEHERKYFHDKVRVEEEIEVKLPKPKYEQAEHSATIVKHSRGKGPIIEIDTTQRTIQGEHETKVVEESVETKGNAMQLLIAKPQISAEHSTTIIKGQHGRPQRFAIDHTQSVPGEYETKYYNQPVQSYSEMEVVFTKQQPEQSSEGEHSSTLIKNVHSKQVVYDKRPLEIPGEHLLTVVDRSTRQKNKEIEFIVPKPQKKRFVDHYQSSSDYDQRFLSSTYEEEEETSGEHTTTYLKQARPKYEAIELVVDRPRQLPSISKLIADIQAETQITSIKPTTVLRPEDSSVKLDMQLNNENRVEQFDEMEIVLERPLVRDSSTTLIGNIQPGLGIQGQLKPSPYISQTIEESSSALTMNLATNQPRAPFELIIPRIDKESSTSTILAQVAPTIGGQRARIDIPEVEKSTSSFIFDQKKRVEEEVELIVPKPKRLETSSSTMIADVEAKLETKNIRPSEIQPESSTSTFYFEETSEYHLPQPVEIRMKQPTIADSSTTLLANVKASLDTQQIQRLGQPYQPFEQSSSAISFETQTEDNQSSEVELILPRPRIQESTSIMLADIRPTLDTSQTHVVIPPPFQSPIKSSSEIIFEEEKFVETTPVELHLHRQPSSHTLLANIDDTHLKNKETYILGTNYPQEQQYGSPTIHADLNKPLELILNVDEGNTSEISQQYRRDYNTRMLTNTTGGIDSSSTMITDIQPRQYQPIEFVVSGGLTGYDTNVNQYSTGTGGYTTTTTTTTTKRKITSDTGDTNRSVIRGIRPYDQVDLVLQPDSSSSSSSKVLTTSIGLDQGHIPYFSLALHDQTAREGESVLFEVIVSAQPSAEIIWDKDGNLIGDDSAFRIDYYGDGRATLYIPEAFLDDQGYYTCTATNTFGTSRTTARLTVDSTGEGIAPKRRQLNGSSTVYYQQGPTQTVESYRVYSQPTTLTEVTEETHVYQIPGHRQQQQNEITYSVQGTQQKYQPVSFLVSTENTQLKSDTSTTRYSQQQQEESISYTSSGPNFTKPLEAIDALEGGTIQITVHLTSFGPNHSRPQIQWYHHAQPIVSDEQHYRITEGYDTSTLEIINVKRGDSGQVWCVATTPAGSATTTCTINISERPVRTSHRTITSQQQVVPQDTIYTTESIHSSRTQIPLYHQQPEQQIPSHYYSSQTINQQQHIVPQETVYKTDSIRSTHAQIPLHHQQPEQRVLSQYYNTQQQISPQSYPSQTPLAYQPEQVSPQLYTSFSAQQPKPQAPFQPYVSQDQQPSSQSFIPQAPPLLPNFNVRPNYSDQQFKVLNNGLQDQPLYTGGETIFECQFTGQPDKVQWFRNEVEIVNNLQQLNNRIYHVTNLTNGTSRLIIKTTLEEDIGTYSVKLTGPTGEETSSAKLIPAAQFQNIQKKKAEQVQRKAFLQELEEKQSKRIRPSKPVTQAPRGSFTSYGTSDDEVFYDTTQRTAPHRQPTVPTVSRPLKDLDVKEGQPIQLTCQVQGFPKSELLWFKNNVPLPLSARHKIAYDAGGGNITLRINDSRPEDSGVYTVIAKNPQGHAETSARVDVRETPGIDETSYVQPDAFKYIEKQPTAPRPTKGRRESDTSNLQQKPAKILKTPMSTSVVEGATATFTCQVEGTPKPKVAWLKDNKPLMAGTRFQTYFDQTSKTAVLRVADISKEDQGYYTCIVDNALNSDRSTATLQVIPETKIDQRSYVETDAFKYLTPENKQLRTANKDIDRPTSGVESESFVNLDSFRYLEAKKPLKTVEDNITIDDRPIVDLEAFRYVEARQAPKGKRDEGSRASIDDTPIIAPDAFRYLERKAEAAKLKKGQDTGPSIDETPQVDLTAFQYLERKEIPKKPEEGPGIDESSIVSPEAFKYLERKPIKKHEDVGPLIDESPMVNPEAFRYLERQAAPQPRDVGPTIDTTPIVNPEVFKYLERPSEIPRPDEGPVIDTRPIVPQEAFRWLDRPKPIERKPEGPAVDESPYVNPKAFRYIEAKPKPKVIDQGPSIDESSYVSPQAFKYLEAAPAKKPVDHGPVIDTSTYVNAQLFEQFEQKPTPQAPYEEQEIKRIPQIIQPLRSTQALETKPAVLVAVVDGFPIPQLTWLKNGAELPASNRVTTNYDIPSKTAWIQIDSARPDDSAVYTLLAHNPAGEVRSDARLNVFPSMTPIDDTAFVPAEAFAKIERATAPRSNIPATTGVDDTAFVNPALFSQFEAPLKKPRVQDFSEEVVIQIPAKILAPLKSIQAPESITVVLEAIVEGSPVPTFTWLKDQVPLSESNRFITNYDLPSKRVTLTIKDVRENDTGIYTLLASNGPQLQHSSATLQIVGAPSVDQSSFISMDVFKQLEQPLNQQPQIPVQAGVDQTSYISQPDRFAVFDQIQPHRKPLNDFGGVDETPLVSMEKIRLLEIPSKVAKPTDIEEKSEVPIVLAPLQPIDAQEGSPVVLTAKISGTPMPNFTWFKDNAPLVASSRFTTYYDIPSKLIVLQINDARPNDTGVYKVRADNKSGDVETSAPLNISSLPSVRDQSFISTDKFRLLEQPNQPRFIEEISGVDERPLVDLTKLRQLEIKPSPISPEEEKIEQLKPIILTPLRNVQAVENQPVVLSAQIEGKPQPQFTWFKNDQPLSEGNRFRTHYDIPSKTIFLTIAGARENDSGTYRLVAQNPLGEEDTSSNVTVDINQPTIDQRSFVPQTAFDKLEKPLLKFNNVTSGVDQTSFFNQDLFRPFDERHIQHPSAIVGGEDSDAAMPVSAPKILAPLRPIKTSEGDTVVLTTQVEGYPLPQFTWVHNNKPIMASNRTTPHYDMLTKRCFLQILDSRPNDVGTYELIAENSAGQDRTKTELTVVPVSKIDQTGYVPYDKFSTLEFKPRIPSDLRSGVDSTPFVSGEIFRLLEAKPINEQFAPEEEQHVPLEVLVPLKPAVAQEGQPVILTTKIRGRPTPQFTWLRNNQPLLESNRFQTHYDFSSETLVLEVSDIWPHDEGTYTVIAEKPKTGEHVTTSAPLTVRQDTTSIDRTAFVAPDAFRSLETAPTLRTVMVESGVDTNSFLTPDVLRALDQGKPKPTDIQEKEQPRTAPKVIVPLQPVKCNEGQPINFTAKIEGTPTPTFTWFKNGQPLQESNRFWSHYDVPSKTVLLQINGARPDDSGTYALVAKNPLGQDQTQTPVNVSFGPKIDTNAFVPPEKFAAFDIPYGRNVPTQAGVDTSPFVQPERFAPLELKAPAPKKEDLEQMEAPKVTKPLQSVQVNEGSPVLLQATVVGKPTPNFVWLKNGAPLAASNRLRTRYDIGTKQVLLQINDARPHDVGEYQVIANNLAGEDSTVGSLSVSPDKPGVDERPFVPTDKFRNLEYPQGQGRRPLEIVPGVDIQPFVSPEKFRKLNEVPSSTKLEEEIPEEKRAPRVIKPLTDSALEELMPVLLTTTIDAGVPMATFTWFKNGQPLLEGNRFTTKYDILTKTLTLQILAARPDDQGPYTVRATNPSGTDETTSQLKIQPTPSIDTRPFVQPERFAPLELKAPIPKKEDLQQMEAPKVIVPLQSVQVNEGSPVLLQATVVGKPIPNFVWLKDSAPLAASNRLRTRYDIGTKQVLLQINDVRPQDVGEYLVIATNQAGEDSTIGSLSVSPDKPGVDDRAFVPTDKFRNLEHPEGQAKRPLEIIPGVDVQPYISPEKFRKLNEVPSSTKPEEEVPEAKRPPRVIVPLTNCALEELMPVILTTTIDAGVPMASFTWFKNGQPLLEGNRFTTKYDILTKTLTLQILAARPDDQGTYTVRATNPSGTDETTSQLNIQPTPSIDTRPFIQPEHFAPLEVKAPVPKKEDLEQMQPPKVIVPLQNEQIKEGAPVLLEATIVGKPTPNFTWFKNGAPLTASNRLRTRYDIGTKQVLLQINDARPQDAGEYLVVATSPAGKDSTVATLNISPGKPGVDDRPFVPTDKFRNLERPEGQAKRPLEIIPSAHDQPFGPPDKLRKLNEVPSSTRPGEEVPEEKRPPRVVVPLSDSVVEELMPVILTTKIDAGVPMATFTWSKNGQPLLDATRYRTEYNIYTTTLTLEITGGRPEDQGTYIARATNPFGSDETTCKLTIKPTPKKGPSTQPEQFGPLEVKAPPPKKGDLEQKQPPKVIVPLENEKVKKGSPVLLKATITGSPTPNFVWFKDNVPLIGSKRLRTRYDVPSKQVLLQIEDVRPEDVGQYAVVATNPAGKDSTTGSVDLLPEKPGVEDQAVVPPGTLRNLKHPEGPGKRPLEIVPSAPGQPIITPEQPRKLKPVPSSTRPEEEAAETMQPPRVIVPLSDSVIEEQMPIVLTTKIDAGVPMASFTWTKNGQPLVEGTRYKTEYNIYTTTLTLQIAGGRPEDQGTYTARATNPLGSDETTCKLTIKPAPQKGPSAQPEQFGPLEVKAPPPKKEDLQQMQPPKVIVPLENEKVKKGSPVILKATIVGQPTPNFAWLKEGAPLQGSKRLRTRYDVPTKQVILQIEDVRPEDVGQYLVVATNPAGQDSTVGSVDLLPEKPGVEDQATVPPGKLRNVASPDEKTKRPINIVPGSPGQPLIPPAELRKLKPTPSSAQPVQEVPEAMRPPRVIVPLSDSVIEELMPIVLTTNIDAGAPISTFTWTKNGQPLVEGTRYKTEYNIFTTTLTLQITGGRPEDQGTYVVRATNPVGSDETTCKLTIKPAPQKGPSTQPEQFGPLEVKAPPPAKEDLEQIQPPKVIVPLENEKVKKGSPVLLKATIIGKPTPDFAWFKDGAPLIGSKRLRTRYDAPTKQVILQIEDVRPEDVGQYLVVATNPAGQDSTVGSVDLLPEKPGVEDQATVPPGKLRNVPSPDEKTKRPINIVPGTPGQPLVSPAELRKLKPTPSSTQPEEEVPEAMRPPLVIVPLADTVIEELMPIVLTTKIDAGVPMASFTWTKNGQPLVEGTRYRTEYNIFTTILTLQITGGRPEDQGTYTVRATNPVGSDETTCKLTIKPAPATQKGPSAQPEQFGPLEVKAPPPKKEDLEQMQPPKVIVPLENEKVKKGSPVLLKATIIGKPTPNFAWFKDGAPLIGSKRLRTRYDAPTKQVILQIEDVRPEDVGQYLVVATNPAGEDSTVGSVGLLPEKPGVEDQAVVPPGKLRNVASPDEKTKRPINIVPGSPGQPLISPAELRKLKPVPPSTRPEEGQVPEAMRPPRVIVPLNNCELEELMPVLLTATIDAGVPMASFTWFKNGQPLLEGNRYTTKYDIPSRVIRLQILASRPEDQGTYTVRAKNPVGSDETTCKLTIRPVASVDTRPFVDAERFLPLEHRPLTAENLDNENQPLRPPKVLIPMNNVRLTEFQPIVLKSIIDAGYPMGKFTWVKDGRPLPESNRYRANFEINTRTASLFIDAARPTTDTGRYTVHVENIVGKDHTIGDVHVEGTPAVDDRPFIEPSKFGKFEGPRGPILRPDDSPRDRENLTPWIRLLKGLEDQLIDETKAAQLVCVVDAYPAATINWFKDGQPLMISQRFMPDYDAKTGVVRLTIYPVYAADSGQYTMVARNIAGEVSTKCTLRIQPTANVEENPLVKFAGLRKTPQQPSGLGPETGHKPMDVDEGQKPYFIKIPVDQEVPEGQLVRLDYIPAGRPEPSLTWYRNGIPLRPDDADHRDVVNEGGVHSLLIRNPQLGPMVEYTCVAKNKFGEAPFTVHLSVVERGSNIPPYFIEQLYNIIIIEGQDARLDACAQGFPEPKVAWEKEGQPLTPNKEYKVEFEGPKTTLYIRGAKMTDAGWYQCTATSPAGTCVTKCKVTVIPLSEAGQYAKELPQFGPQVLSKLPSLPEEDIRSKYMTVPVKPPEVKPEELYKLPKRPKKGEDVLEEVKRRGLKVLPDEVLSALQKNLEEFPEEEMYSKDRPQPPKFKVHIKSHLNLNEDEPCLFEAKLIPVRDPMMRVQWFKNGKVLHHASRIIPRYDFADVSLAFLYTFAEDDGIYECVATNPYGEDRTRAELKCRPKRSIIYNTQLPEGMEGVSKLQMLEDEIRYTASMIGLEEKVQEKEPKIPEFIMPLEDISVDEGDNAKFIAKVDGHPRPRVTWSINGSDIANGSRYKLVFDGLVHYLDIPKTRQYDAGLVRCVAKNSLGQAESVATLNLKFREDYRSHLSKVPGGIETGLDDSFDVDIEERLRLRTQIRQRESVDDRARRPSTDKLIHPLHAKATDRMSWRQTVEKAGDAPNFTKPLLPLKAKEGSKVVVSVEFTGEPAPTVSWYRDGFMVEDSEDFKIHTTPTQSILTIKHAFIIDSGLYTVKLFNPIGIRQCQAAIRILPIIAEDQTPRFLDVPHDSEILAGEPVRFQCRVEGEPFPTVAFYREDEPVNLNDKRFRVIQEGDVFILLLFEALPADSGQYEAVAENTVGKANTRFTLIVTPRVPGGKKASIIDDPKLIHKVPYLEKPLEDLHVKEGQSATFECIIPASFGSDVKWYKGTSEWPIKPSKFFKPKSDGTKHQLFILEAYAEDEELYKCVVSNPVGTTATTATLKVDHAMQVPAFIHGFSNLTTYEGEQVRFEVEVRGDPPPTISWYRGGEIIRDSPDFQIFTEGNHSLLYISEVFMEDQGLFTCTASNSAGSSDCSARLIVEPRPQL